MRLAQPLRGELVSFQTRDKFILHGLLVRPKQKSSKAIIHIHGSEGSFYRNTFMKLLAQNAAKRGFNFLTIELRGSYTAVRLMSAVKRKTAVLGGGGFENFKDCTYDIEAAVRFLVRLGINRIFLEGHSTGCQKIAYYQYKAKDRRIKGLILVAPADDYNIWKNDLGQRFTGIVNKARKIYNKDPNGTMAHILNRNMSAARFLSYTDNNFIEAQIFNYDLPRLKWFGSIQIPILAVFGSKEEYAIKPVEECMRILQHNSTSRLFAYKIIEGGDHNFRKREQQLSEVILKWIASI